VGWAFVRPKDATLLEGRPLLDLGTGDGQTLRALTHRFGVIVGLDADATLLRPGNVNAQSDALPFADGALAVVLAADLFHHLDDARLVATLAEIARVLRPRGRLIAWWYESTPDTSPDAPRYTRSFDQVAAAVTDLRVEPLELETEVASSATVGILATR
jgi:SAM-dependent methyltransferase